MPLHCRQRSSPVVPADSSAPQTVTRLLHEVGQGNSRAMEQLLPLVYAELHYIAERHMAGERTGHTLQPTALVNEAFLRLVGGTPAEFHDRAHFLRAASGAMRRVLVDHARKRHAAKRGDGGLHVTLDDAVVAAPGTALDILPSMHALTRSCRGRPALRRGGGTPLFRRSLDPRMADALGVSMATVKRRLAVRARMAGE